MITDDTVLVAQLILDYDVLTSSMLGQEDTLLVETKDALEKIQDADDDYEYNLYESILKRNIDVIDKKFVDILYKNKMCLPVYLNDTTYEGTINRVLANLCLYTYNHETGYRSINTRNSKKRRSNYNTIENLKELGYIDYKRGLNQRIRNTGVIK